MHTGFIYKIIADNTDKVYYGSTIQSLTKRFSRHKYDFIKSLESPLYFSRCSSSELFNYPNCRIETLETHHNIDIDLLKKTLIEIESGYILRFRKYRPDKCINNRLPNRTDDKLKEYRKKYSKQYQSKNKIKIKEQKRLAYLAKKNKLN